MTDPFGRIVRRKVNIDVDALFAIREACYPVRDAAVADIDAQFSAFTKKTINAVLDVGFDVCSLHPPVYYNNGLCNGCNLAEWRVSLGRVSDDPVDLVITFHQHVEHIRSILMLPQESTIQLRKIVVNNTDCDSFESATEAVLNAIGGHDS